MLGMETLTSQTAKRSLAYGASHGGARTPALQPLGGVAWIEVGYLVCNSF